MRACFGLILVAAAGCGAAHGVAPEILDAKAQAAPASPGELADVTVAVALHGYGRANNTPVALAGASLSSDDGTDEIEVTLGLAFAGDADPTLDAGDVVRLALANNSTTNGDLAPLCGRAAWLHLAVRERDGGPLDRADRYPLTVDCAGE